MANDTIHETVKNALVKDGWRIIKEHLHLEYEELDIFIDLLAERAPFVAEKDNRQILVEVKTFGDRSFMRALQQALGQYQIYADFMEFTGLDYELYLAVSNAVYETFLRGTATRRIIQRHRVNLLIVNVEQEEIVEWIKEVNTQI